MLQEMMNTEPNPTNPQPERRKEDRRQKEQHREDERRRGDRREGAPASGRNMRRLGSRSNEPETTPGSLPLSRKHGKTPETWPGENFQSGTSQAQEAEGRTPQQQTVPAKMLKPRSFTRTRERREKAERRYKSMRASGGLTPVFRPLKQTSASPDEPRQRERRSDSRPQSEPGDRKRPFDKAVNKGGERKDFGESHDRPFGDRDRGAGGKIDSTQRDMGQTGQNMKGGAGAEIHEQQGPYGPRKKHRGPVAPGKPLMDDWGKSDKH